MANRYPSRQPEARRAEWYRNRNVIPVLENRSLVLAGLAYLRKGCHAKAA